MNVAMVKIIDSDAKEFIRLFNDGLEIRLKTPRTAKRFENALAFTLAINKGEVNAVEMMLVGGIRIFHPNAYVAIKRSRDILATSGIDNGVEIDPDERVQRFFSAAVKGLTTAEASAPHRLLLALFPRIVGRAKFEPDELAGWAKARRLTSAEYFDRYFSYSLPSKDQHEDNQEFVARIRRLEA